MLQQLFINACILITIIFITSQLFLSNGPSATMNLKMKIILGIMGGLSSIILIYYSIPITSNVILDFREMCIILAAVFGGIIPAFITGIITMIFRVFYSSFDKAAYIAAVGIFVISIGCGLISYTRLSRKRKGWTMLFYSLSIRSIVYFIVVQDIGSAGVVIIEMWISYTILATGVFYFVGYLVTSHRLLRELKEESTHDYLTGLRNTRSFHKKLSSIQDYTRLNQGRLSILMIDIDHYKTVNDSFGHAAGDMVLKEMGKLLKCINKESYLVSRIGGEEFSIILKDDDKEMTFEKAEKIRKTIATHKFTIQGGKKIKLTVSIGAAIYPDTVENLENLLETADKRLYEAKHSGRNKVCI